MGHQIHDADVCVDTRRSLLRCREFDVGLVISSGAMSQSADHDILIQTCFFVSI